MSEPLSLDGKAAIVTGASSGIGRANRREARRARGARSPLGPHRCPDGGVAGADRGGRRPLRGDRARRARRAAGPRARRARRARHGTPGHHGQQRRPVISHADRRRRSRRVAAPCWRRTCWRASSAARPPSARCAPARPRGTSSTSPPSPRSGPIRAFYGATKHAVTCISHTLRRELEEDSIRVVDVRPGAIATNFARNFDPAFVANFVRATGSEIEVKRGERLPDEVMEKLQPRMQQVLASPDDVANAVLYAVTQPIQVNVAEIVVRPPKQLAL